MEKTKVLARLNMMLQMNIEMLQRAREDLTDPKVIWPMEERQGAVRMFSSNVEALQLAMQSVACDPNLK